MVIIDDLAIFNPRRKGGSKWKWNFYRAAIWNRNNRFSWKISWKSKKGEGSVSILEHPRFLGFLNASKARTKFRKWNFHRSYFEIKIAMVFLRNYFFLKMWGERRKMYTDIRANIALYYEPSQPLTRSRRRLMQADRKWNFYRSEFWNRNNGVFGNHFSWRIEEKKGYCLVNPILDIRALRS